MRDTYIACTRICTMWSQLYNAPERKKGVSKDNGFLCRKNEKEDWGLALLSTFDKNGKNYFEEAINKANDATAHSGIGKMFK